MAIYVSGEGIPVQENRQSVFDVEESRIFRTELSVPKAGYYRVRVGYSHNMWDAWMQLDVVGESGETMRCIPPLPRKYTQTTLLLYLFSGVNRITAVPRCDHIVHFWEMELLGEAAELNPEVIPSEDRFYLSEPRERRLTMVSFTGVPEKITAEDREIPFELESKALYDHADPVETREPYTYHHIRLHPDALSGMEAGEHILTIHLPENQSVPYRLTVKKERKKYDFQIVNLDVNHGNCVLLRLPNGKNLLIDTGTENSAGDVIFPYLEEQKIGIDYLLISHYHGDHAGSLAAVLERYPLEKPGDEVVRPFLAAADHEKRESLLSAYRFLDSSVLCRYDRLDWIWDLGGVEILVLNSSYERDGRESIPGSRGGNETSVSMIVSYRGFRYYHGADNHAVNQQRNLKDFSEAGQISQLECHYMQANHHFHGDLLPEMIRTINPVAVVVPAHQAIYSRSAYMVEYVRDVKEMDYPNKRLQDTFVSYMSGTVCAFINSAEDWHYETY